MNVKVKTETECYRFFSRHKKNKKKKQNEIATCFHECKQKYSNMFS